MIEALVGLLAGASSVGAVWIWMALSPKLVVRKLIARRYAVTLKGGDGEFAGLLVEMPRAAMVFEECTTIPRGSKEAPEPIAGRVRVDRANVAYLQELTNVVE
jgi:hypothetical protein